MDKFGLVKDWELVAKSIRTGMKLCDVDADAGCYFYFDRDNGDWVDQDNEAVKLEEVMHLYDVEDRAEYQMLEEYVDE